MTSAATDRTDLIGWLRRQAWFAAAEDPASGGYLVPGAAEQSGLWKAADALEALTAERDRLAGEVAEALDAIETTLHGMREPMTLDDARSARHGLTVWSNQQKKTAVLRQRALNPQPAP